MDSVYVRLHSALSTFTWSTFNVKSKIASNKTALVLPDSDFMNLFIVMLNSTCYPMECSFPDSGNRSKRENQSTPKIGGNPDLSLSNIGKKLVNI